MEDKARKILLLSLYGVILLIVAWKSWETIPGSDLVLWSTFSLSNGVDGLENRVREAVLPLGKETGAHFGGGELVKSHACVPRVRIHVVYMSSYFEKDEKAENAATRIRGIPRELQFGLLSRLLKWQQDGNLLKTKVIPKYSSYSIDGESLLSCEEKGCSLDMKKAFQVGWHAYSHTSEFPVRLDMPTGTILLVDVHQGYLINNSSLVSPLVGRLSDKLSIAVVNSSNTESQSIVAAEIKQWLYGPEIAQHKKSTLEIAYQCHEDVYHELNMILNSLHHSRQLRLERAVREKIMQLVTDFETTSISLSTAHTATNKEEQLDILERIRELRMQLDAIDHSSGFGIETRMPPTHTVALMLPFGLPLCLTFFSTLKYLITDKGKREKMKHE
eukprot:jgi/Picsp_1/981/NSC_04465-R1_---NA---